MNYRLIIVALIVVVLGIFLYNRYNSEVNAPEPVGEVASGESIEEGIEQILGRQIADDIPKSEISDDDAMAVVTYNPASNPPQISVLADLPETESQYQVKLSNGEDSQVLGVMQNVKGGYVLETTTELDTSEYNNLQITTPNETTLQGILNL